MESLAGVLHLITEFRTIAQDPSRRELLERRAVDVFLPPTQAIVFEFLQPNYTVIFFTRFEGEPDQRITLAAKGSFQELFHALPDKWRTLENKQIRHPWTPNSFESIHQLIEDTMQRLFGNLAEQVCRDEPAHFTVSLSPDVAILEARTCPGDIDAKMLIAEMETRAQNHGVALPQPFRSAAHERKAHAGNIVPLTVVGDEQQLTFQQKVENEWRGQELWKLSAKSWTSSWDQFPLIVFAEGMIVADTPHQDKVLLAINSFLALCQYFGHSCIPMTVYDLGSARISASGSMLSWGGPAVMSKQILATKKNMPVITLRRVFSVLEKCNDETLVAQLRLWHAGCAHYLSGESLQAFVLGWTAIENLLGKLWGEYLHDHGIADGRLNKLTSPQGGFTSDHVIEFLNLIGRVDAATYSQLQELRKTRNKSVHSGREPVPDETAKCLRLARELLSARLNSYLIPSETSLPPTASASN